MTSLGIIVNRRVVADTIAELRQRGAATTERFALWLGKRAASLVTIAELYVPRYEAASDYFHVDRQEMARLMIHLRERGLMIGAQLHTHPAEAFHSLADDRWAIVRHVGALSIVLPEFGRWTTPQNFFVHAKLFSLSVRNNWTEIPQQHSKHFLEVI